MKLLNMFTIKSTGRLFLSRELVPKKSLVTSHQVLRKAFQVDFFSVGNFSITAKPPTDILDEVVREQ